MFVNSVGLTAAEMDILSEEVRRQWSAGPNEDLGLDLKSTIARPGSWEYRRELGKELRALLVEQGRVQIPHPWLDHWMLWSSPTWTTISLWRTSCGQCPVQLYTCGTSIELDGQTYTETVVRCPHGRALLDQQVVKL